MTNIITVECHCIEMLCDAHARTGTTIYFCAHLDWLVSVSSTLVSFCKTKGLVQVSARLGYDMN